MSKSQESRVLIIVIIGLFLILIGTGLHMATNYKVKQPKQKDDTIQDTTQKVDVNKLEMILTDLTTSFDRPCGFYEYFNEDTYTYQDISNEDALNIVMAKIYKDKISQGIDDTSLVNTFFSKKEVLDTMSSLFTSKYQFSDGNFPNFQYDDEEQAYLVKTAPSCGGVCAAKNIYQLTKALKYSDYLEIQLRVAFVDVADKSIKYYKDYNKNNLLKEIDMSSFSEKQILTDEELQQTSLYKMTFNIENGNCVFLKSEIINK